jgi:Fe(3+) dicitrate transport protein
VTSRRANTACLIAFVVSLPVAASAQPATLPSPVDSSAPADAAAAPSAVASPAPATDAAATPAPTAATAALAPGTPTRSYSSTVHGDKGDTLRRASGSRVVITQEDIARAQPESASEMLVRVPGLQVRQEDQSGFRLNLGVRGLSPERSRLVLVEEDGVPVVVSPYGEPELYYMTSVERIQSMDVLKGSDVLRYGPQTVGAAIQLHTWEPTLEPSWYTSVTGGQRGFFETTARYAGTLQSGVGYVVSGYYKRGDGYRGMGFDAADVMGKLRIPTSASGEFHFKLAYHDELARTTYTGLTDTMYVQDPRQNTVAPNDHFGIQRFELALTHDQRWGGNTRLHTALFFYQMNLDLRLQDFDRSELPEVGFTYVRKLPGLDFRNTTSLRDRVYDVAGASAELEQRFNLGPLKNKLTVGTRLMYDAAHRRLSQGSFPTADSGDLQTDDTTQIFGLSTWIEDQIALGDLVLVTPAFRFEYSHSTLTTHRIYNAPSPPQDVDLSGTSSANGSMPGIGIVVGKPALNVFTSFYLGYSGPRVSQAITPDGHDTNLHPEHSSNYELGLRGRVGSWLRAEGDFFFINFDNQLISNNPLSGSDSEFVDGGRTQHVGAEATATIRFGRACKLPLDVDLGGQYTFVHSRFVGGSFNGKAVPYSPVNTAVLTLDLAHKIGVGAQVAFSYVGQQFSDEQNSIEPGPTGLDGRIDAYTTLDVTARYRNARTGLGLAVSMKNALDRVYISDRLPNGIFTAGFRQIFATLSWSRD